MNSQLKIQALKLRSKGFSYSEISKEIVVSKSTLSYWFRYIKLPQKENELLKKKKRLGALKGADVRKQRRIEETQEIHRNAISEIEHITKRELWLIGIVLYWAEGAKSKRHNPSQGVIFSNSDPLMIKLFVTWLLKCLAISTEKLQFEIYIDITYKERLAEVKTYWSQKIGFPIGNFDKIYFKQHLNKPKRSYSNSYFGLMRVKVRRSTVLNRYIAGWISGINNYCGVVQW